MKLTTKLVWAFIGSIVLLSGFSTIMYDLKSRNVVFDDEASKAQAVVTTLQATHGSSASASALQDDLSAIQSKLPDLINADIYDVQSGKAIASTSASAVGQALGATDALAAKSKEALIHQSGSHEQVVSVIRDASGEPKYIVDMSMNLANQVSEVNGMLYINVSVTVIFMLAQAIVAWWILRKLLTQPLAEIVRIAKEIANGNLTIRVANTKRKDEVGELNRGFEKMIESLQALVTQVGENAEQVAAASQELSASAEETSRAAEQIALCVSDVARGSERQVGLIGQGRESLADTSNRVEDIHETVTQVSSAATHASNMANDGTEVLHQVETQMESIRAKVNHLALDITELREQSKEIDGIVTVIEDIARETNLLALNAAIEAARAGEQGKGFSVVADEVRKLAEQSTASAQDIRDLVATIQENTKKVITSMEHSQIEVQSGLSSVEHAEGSFQMIRESVEQVAVQVQSVSDHTKKLAEGAIDLRNSMNQVSLVSEEAMKGTMEMSASSEAQLASMEEITASSMSLATLAERMLQSVNRFKV